MKVVLIDGPGHRHNQLGIKMETGMIKEGATGTVDIGMIRVGSTWSEHRQDEVYRYLKI